LTFSPASISACSRVAIGVALAVANRRRVSRPRPESWSLRRTRRLCAVVIAMMIALSPAPGTAGVRPVYGGELRALLPATPAQLDPARATSPSDLVAVRAAHATLLEVDAHGELRPSMIEAVPQPEAGGRSFRLRLLPGLRFQDGAPVTAPDVARTLSRLAEPGAAHGWVAAPIRGFAAVHDGHASMLEGVEVLSPTELRVELAYPFAEFPQALAALPAAVVHAGPGGQIAGAGPFRPTGPAPGSALRMTAFDGCAAGRPFTDALVLAGADARGAARALARAGADVVLRPEAPPGGLTAAPSQDEVVVALVSRRLGAASGPTLAALAALDRAELSRRVRGPAKPLTSLLPEPLLTARPPTAPPLHGALPARLSLLLAAEPGAPREAAERIQVKLYDRGVRVAVEPVLRSAFESRLAIGDFDVALVPVWLLARSPAFALGEVAWVLGGPARGAEALSRAARASAAELPALAAGLERELLAVPLYATGLRLTSRPEVQGVARAADGTWTAGDTWLLPGAGGRAP
jgi:peptide/nickel transport system substrate-binding protein